MRARGEAGAGGSIRGHPPPPPPSFRTPPVWPAGPKALPAPMLDLHPRRRFTTAVESDLDLGRVGSISADVPGIPEPARRLPQGDLTPFHFVTVGRALEDPPTRAPLEDDLQSALAGHRMRARPPARGAPGPEIEGILEWAFDVEGEAQRLDDHLFERRDRVFSAISLKCRAASPQTSSRYA